MLAFVEITATTTPEGKRLPVREGSLGQITLVTGDNGEEGTKTFPCIVTLGHGVHSELSDAEIKP